MKTTRFFLTFLCIFCCIGMYPNDYKIAMISDADGYCNIRSGPGKDHQVLATISKGELFYCKYTDSEWVKIFSFKYNKGNQVEGYMHRSRVQLVELLPAPKLKKLITTILTEQKRLAYDFQNNRSKGATVLENYSDDFYSPILNVLPGYFCKTKDREIIRLFFDTMWADSGSANEIPAYAIGDCFACQTNIMLEEIKKLPKHQKAHITEGIEWGLMNNYSADEDGHSDNPEYNRLMLLLKAS